jgi:diamine N-acetyltransferase
MAIHLEAINEENWEECVSLEVSDQQREYLPSNVHSIAEAKFNDKIKLLGIYNDTGMIGFASYILDEEGDMNLYKFMIDKQYQGKGYGKEALLLLMNIIIKETKNNEVWLSLHPNNAVAIKLYCSYGFKQCITGLETEDEIFYKYDIGD